jgi:hypothetical protein
MSAPDPKVANAGIIRRMRRFGPRLAAGLLLAGSTGVHAAELSAQLEAGYFDLTGARSSAKALFDGSSGGLIAGAGVRGDLGRRFFLGARVRRFAKDGERVFVANPDATPFPLGHPLTLRLVPVDLTLGYRFSPRADFRPYLGAGAGVAFYRERSEVAGVEQRESRTRASAHALLGVEWGRSRLRLAAELEYSTVPGAVGLGGVSKVYDESNVGGLAIVGKLRFGGQ